MLFRSAADADGGRAKLSSPDDTGIPALKQYLLSITSEIHTGLADKVLTSLRVRGWLLVRERH